ncbi:sugar ABC transporter permease [Carboxydochorda subterranea]|uniref:Sugar ABC transporter permease n=1 Tax=Carboxydichorda subterranea TaxID=3109565 RepID=A0ABZ1C1L2_9FIRM|nr:sugar ABC transporter permease [Limnochorda sp. L945t]WRP18735.1 sugar ABC transporter permease [Limnochorda sp. L945t]
MAGSTAAVRQERLGASRWAGLPGLVFVLPAVLVVLGVVGYPFVEGIWLSLTNRTVASEGHFIGFKNYANLLHSAVFLKTVRNTLVYTGVGLVGKLVLGMAVALSLTRVGRGRDLLGALLLLPWIIPTVLSALVWTWIFDDTSGILNYALVRLHLVDRPVPWLGSSALAMASVILVAVWRETPYFGLSLLAGLRSIPQEQYEAASLDGAGTLQQFRYVTLPNLLGLILLVSTISVVQSAYDFSIVYILTRGGPVGATHIFSTLTYEIGFYVGDLGRAGAVALTAFPIFGPLMFYIARSLERREASL